MTQRLVIAVGNQARGDDGVAHAVADALQDRLPEDTRLLRVHQLDIVLAEEVAATDLVVFVDAQRREAPAVTVERVDAGTPVIGAHFVDPAGLLGVVEALYGGAPGALLVTVAAPLMGHGGSLSDIAAAGVVQAAETVLDGLRR